MKALTVMIFCVILSLAAISTPALAQNSPIDKGVWKLDGGISFVSEGGDLYKDSHNNGVSIFTFTPTVQYFDRDMEDGFPIHLPRALELIRFSSKLPSPSHGN